MKKISCALSLIIGLVFLTSTVFASEQLNNDGERYIACPQGGKHIMHPVGSGSCYTGQIGNPGKREFGGPLSQCDKCSIYMLSQSYPGNTSRALGKYTVTYTLELLGGVAVVYGGSMGSYDGGSNPDTFIQGFDFKMS